MTRRWIREAKVSVVPHLGMSLAERERSQRTCHLRIKVGHTLSVWRAALIPSHPPARMESAMTAVHLQLGPASTITDRDIKDALWNYYFDVAESIAYLKGTSHRKLLARPIAMALTRSQHTHTHSHR